LGGVHWAVICSFIKFVQSGRGNCFWAPVQNRSGAFRW
jgi:hypothetical protein